MPRGPLTFKPSVLTAALKAVEAAGCEVASVKVRKDGEIVIEIGKPQGPPSEPENPWDEVLKR